MKRNTRWVLFLAITTIAMVSASIHSSPAQLIGSFKITKLVGSAGSGAPHKADPHMINASPNSRGSPCYQN